jgi:NAD-dependent deacetylase
VDQPERAIELMAAAAHVVALTGAGISTDSGIPDYRGPNGVWTRNPEAERNADIDVYRSDPQVRVRAWQRRLAWEEGDHQPNPGHQALVDLEGQGRLHTLVTQNIDGLHRAAGTSEERLVEVHGTVHEVVCLSCVHRAPATDTLDRVRSGEAEPACPDCGGILKTATISFGQPLVPADIERAIEASAAGDLFLAVGTSLAVYPVAHTVSVALEVGIPVVIVNAEPTPFDDAATAVVRRPISEALPRLVAAPR